jgi:hypothetical protein
MNMIQRAILSLTLAAASIGTAYALGRTGTTADFGQSVPNATAARVISIDSSTKYVNVEDGETVQFEVQGQCFTWHFSTFPNTAFDLRRIAPSGISVGAVEVYVASNPLYRG